ESPDDILEATRKSMEDKKAAESASNKSDADDLLDQLGL
ncbi:DUF3334 family protein, partial [Vibrio campbellii]